MTEQNIKEILEQEKVKTLWEGAPTSIVVGTAAAVFTSATMYSQVNHSHEYLWISGIFLTGLIRYFFAYQFKKNPKSKSPKVWLDLYFYSSGAVAVVWSVLPLFVQGFVDSDREIIMSTVILAVGCGGAISSIADKKTAFFYFFVMIGVYTVNVLVTKGSVAFLFAAAIVFFMGFIYRMVTQFNRLYNSSVSQALELKDKFELEKQLAQEKERAFQSSKLASLGEMAAGIAHEINNPLTVSLGKIHMLRKKLGEYGEYDDSVEKILKDIENSNVRISEIVFSMKNLSRMNQEAELDPFLPDDLMQIVVPIVSTKIKWGKIHFDVDMKEATMLGNKGEISQILINFIHNAADAIKNEKDKWINVTGRVIGSEYVIKVTNPGDPIPDEIANKLFDPFFTTKDTGEGTGLGLSLSKSLAERSGGSIKLLKDEPSITFELRLKLA